MPILTVIGVYVDPFKYHRHLRHAMQYIEDHLTEPIGLVDVAHEIGLSPTYLSTFFHKTTGRRFSDWLSCQRLTRAKQLLHDRDQPIYQVAAETGFGSVSTFERTFKKYEGITPSEFRKHSPTSE